MPVPTWSQGIAVGWGQPKAATVGESYARGMADVIRSQASANYTNAAAVGALEDARTKYLNNRALAAQTYMANKRMMDDYRAEERQDQQRKLAAYLEQGKLAPLSSSDVYPDTGAVAWPPILLQEKFSEPRSFVEKAFAKRAAEGSLTSTQYMQTSLMLNNWRRGLAGPADPFTQNDAREAAQFLNRLDGAIKADYQ